MSSVTDTNYLNGLAVKRQISIYEQILNGRIQLQRAITELNKALLLCQSIRPAGDEEREQVNAALDDARTGIVKLLARLVVLRSRLFEANEITVPTVPAPSSATRITKPSRTRIAPHVATLHALFSASSPFRDAVLEKWSQRVQSSDGLGALVSSAAAKKFSVLNQSVRTQVVESLRDMERLVARTRVNRAAAAGLGTEGKNEVVRVHDSDMDSRSFIFDDTDFYQVLLKDLVDKNMADSDTISGGVKWTVSKPKTHRADVDTKASKGRKLRYHVQEKVQNFMPPVPSNTWSDEQIDDLFMGLFGQKIMDVVAAEER
ncbi:apoptosis-antagonizing transcription factor [Limtongia smithiae]|uniref:apoptosis-antagonizing transcription factor n=1 Tax=Limtongia smithiae TaxID=1125753 RepID=UPI0034CFA3C5